MLSSDSKLYQFLTYHVPVGRWLMGIPVAIHWSLLLVPLLIYYPWYQAGYGGWYGAIVAILTTISIYTFVYLHECGHAFAFRAYNLPVSKITLGMLGGLCHGPGNRTPREEIVTTFFGPLVNLVFVVLFLGGLLGWQGLAGEALGIEFLHPTFKSWRLLGMEILSFLFLINFAMAFFNLVCPIFPMDIARIIRATLAHWYPPAKATRAVVYISYVTGIIVILLALLDIFGGAGISGFWMVAIVLTMWQGTRQEWERIKYEPVYVPASYLYQTDWREMDEEQELWKQAAKPKQPGVFARWRARRAEKKQLQAEKQAEEKRLKVDRLLEKISNEGIGALSKKERDFLLTASKSFRNRVS